MKLQVTIERSLIPGSSSMKVFGLLSLLLFVRQMIFFFALPIASDRTEDILPVVALISSVLLASLIIYMDEKRNGATQQLQIELQEAHIMLIQGAKEFLIPMDEITEVIKVMRFDRYYPEKGKYKVIIKRRKCRSLTFMSTDQEYDIHAEFGDTDLSKFYDALRSHGVKCC